MVKNLFSLILLVLVLVVLVGCSSEAPKSQSTSQSVSNSPEGFQTERKQLSQRSSISLPVANPQTILRFHGSNTIGAELLPKLTEEFLHSLGAGPVVRVSGLLENEMSLQAYLPDLSKVVAVEIEAHGSSTGFLGLESKKADIAMASRPIKNAERLNLMQLHGDLGLSENTKVLGLDGLAIITHPNNPITRLSLSQIAKIFSGEIDNWSAFGLSPAKIKLLSRDDKSGTFDSFVSMVMKPQKLKLSRSSERFESNQKLSGTVNQNLHAIGFVPLAHVGNNRLIEVSYSDDSLAMVPSEFLINTEDYPLGRRLYLYKSGRNANRFVDKFFNFVSTREAQKIVQNTQFVQKKIFPAKIELEDEVSTKYQRLTFEHERLSLNFRLAGQSSSLDPKAQEDLDKLADYLKSESFSSVRLIGFHDDQVNEDLNVKRSSRRAMMLMIGLKERGVKNVESDGLGSDNLLAPTEFESNRPINDRIEVWVKRKV